jgi:anti-anti-sigma factor
VLQLALSGEVDVACAGEVEAELLAEAAQHASVLLDLAGLTFLDAACLSALLRVHHSLQARGGGLAIQRPRPFQRRLFEWTGLSGLLEDQRDPDLSAT